MFRYQFQQTSPITLTVVNSGGNLTGLPMVDTRLQAAALTRVERFSTVLETAEPSQVNVNYEKISQSVSASSKFDSR